MHLLSFCSFHLSSINVYRGLCRHSVNALINVDIVITLTCTTFDTSDNKQTGLQRTSHLLIIFSRNHLVSEICGKKMMIQMFYCFWPTIQTSFITTEDNEKAENNYMLWESVNFCFKPKLLLMILLLLLLGTFTGNVFFIFFVCLCLRNANLKMFTESCSSPFHWEMVSQYFFTDGGTRNPWNISGRFFVHRGLKWHTPVIIILVHLPL